VIGVTGDGTKVPLHSGGIPPYPGLLALDNLIGRLDAEDPGRRDGCGRIEAGGIEAVLDRYGCAGTTRTEARAITDLANRQKKVRRKLDEYAKRPRPVLVHHRETHVRPPVKVR
jgi:hypothetical protein